ncbi:MAG: thymidine phosphorylase family protein [Wenzhouxiangellaceae bacterium]|nr:thymidine phosphorylase family protein [Wenzhouxiangellaceae bacterium]
MVSERAGNDAKSGQPASSVHLQARCMDLDTRGKPVAILRSDSPLCRAEGFSAHARIHLRSQHDEIIAELFQTGSELLGTDQIGLSIPAWRKLQVCDGDDLHIAHPRPLRSLAHVRGKVYGQPLKPDALEAIMSDIVRGRYDEIELAMFLTAIASRALDDDELVALTGSMVDVGDRLEWTQPMLMDKHCVGGLPGNRTTPIVVAIVAANGLAIPKTSSRAITSPAGTADTMEMLAPVNLGLSTMRRVVEAEGGCVVWGGSVRLSPVDDILIRVARVMDLDAEAQMVASVLSKKIAAGSTHLVLDVPIGKTAKVRSRADGHALARRMESTADAFGLVTRIVLTDGSQPVGRGIGPALEARDILAVLQGVDDQPLDLRERAADLAGELLEMGGAAPPGQGRALATQTLVSGAAWRKFQAICRAQGGLRTPPSAPAREVMTAADRGTVQGFDNRLLGRVAKLAGAPAAPAAGVELHVHLGDRVEQGAALYTIHAETRGELEYAREFAGRNGEIIQWEAR